jgi:RNA polymerase sigma factor (sigma-70 family)
MRSLFKAVGRLGLLCMEESRDKLFASTCWTTVLEAGDLEATSSHALSALAQLCQAYWRPMYAFQRKRGYSHHDAQDLIQNFFTHLIETRGYARADRSKGRFRSFLLTSLKHFIADVRDRKHALKRGGGAIIKSLDDKTEMQIACYVKSPADEVYDREWAESLVRHALTRLGQECALAGKTALFDRLRMRLAVRGESAIPWAELAQVKTESSPFWRQYCEAQINPEIRHNCLNRPRRRTLPQRS